MSDSEPLEPDSDESPDGETDGEHGSGEPVNDEIVNEEIVNRETDDDATDDMTSKAAVGFSRRALVGTLLGLLVLYLVATFVDVWLASRADYEPGMATGSPTAAVVLGAAQYNGEPSPVLQARLDEALALYEANEVDLVVVTGGGQETDLTTEAKTGYDYLREQTDIPDEDVRLEVQGASTYESLSATARFLERDGVVAVVLVTDRYHAKRSMLIAKEVGLEPVVSLTPQKPSFSRLVKESGAVGLGRIIGFRRLERL